jgi:hypothetical protein
MVVDVQGYVVSTQNFETKPEDDRFYDMDHPPADQVALGIRSASEFPNQLDLQADHVCFGVSRGRCHNVKRRSA